MTNRTTIAADALRGTAKALRALKGDIVLCGACFNGTADTPIPPLSMIGEADFSVSVKRKALVDTLAACAPVQLGVTITWTADEATIACGDFVAKLPAAMLDVSCVYIDTIPYRKGLGALAKFAKKSKKFNFILLCGGAAYATDGVILARVEYDSEAVDGVEHYIAPDALIGHKDGDGVALYGAETGAETVTRSVNASSGVTTVSRAKIGHRPRIREAVSGLLSGKNPNYRVGFDVKALVGAHALVCAGAAITKYDKKTLIAMDHDKDAGTLSLHPYQPDWEGNNAFDGLTKIAFSVDCLDFDVSPSHVRYIAARAMYTTAGVLQGICRLFDAKARVELIAYEDIMTFGNCRTFVIAMGCNPDYARPVTPTEGT